MDAALVVCCAAWVGSCASATPLTRVSHALQQAASQKRQGTKSREVVHPTLRAGTDVAGPTMGI
jgi:hypothetical protein